MTKILNKSNKKSNKKGFTILELLVVVAIIAILAAIAIPQFMGAIDKSRVSAQIADCASVSKAVTMYNFDTSSYPLSQPATAAVTGGWITDATAANNCLLGNQDPDAADALTSITGYNGSYVGTYPAKNKWGGSFTYANLIAAPTAGSDEEQAGLKLGNVVIKMDTLTSTQAGNLDLAADSTSSGTTGVFRFNTAKTVGFYVIN